MLDDTAATREALLHRKLVLARMGANVLVLRLVACAVNEDLYKAELLLTTYY